MIDIPHLIQRMTQNSVIARYAAQRQLDEVLNGEYRPDVGSILPPWKAGSSRRLAFERALRKTQTEGPRIVKERLTAGYGTITWTNADTGEPDERIDDALNRVDLRSLARASMRDYVANGIAAVLPYSTVKGRPTLDRLTGLIEPYVDPLNVNRLTGLYRALSYVTTGGKVRWRVEVFDFDGKPDDQAAHRYWTDIEKPTDLGNMPEEYDPAPRPAFVIDQLSEDGLPIGQLETALPIILGLYATELQLATAQEISAYPMLKVKGSTDGIKQVGPAEVVGVDRDGDAEWMTPGNLTELRARRAEQREGIREAAFMHAGSLGTETPSGEALIQANRVPAQADSEVAESISALMTDAATRYLNMLDLPGARVQITPDQSYRRQARWDALIVADNLGALPFDVKARIVQELIGGAYTDKELAAFIEANRPPTLRREPGEPA